MRKLYEIFKIFKIQKRNSFRGNYSRKYGTYTVQSYNQRRWLSFLGILVTFSHQAEYFGSVII